MEEEKPKKTGVKPLSREETNGDEKKGRESSKENILSDEDRRWLQEYGDGKPPNTNDYLKQSKGH
jgi:hypothetical protein